MLRQQKYYACLFALIFTNIQLLWALFLEEDKYLHNIYYKTNGELVTTFSEFITGVHDLYDRYLTDWTLVIRSYYGGPEYRNGQYLKAYEVDTNTPSETINTYQLDADGNTVSKMKAQVSNAYNSRNANDNDNLSDGSFYSEKLHNTPNLNYLKLYVSEYNSLLFRTPPQRVLPNTPEVNQFVNNVNSEGDSINEFMSQVDILTTVYGIAWVSCMKFGDNPIPTWQVHSPIDVKNWEYGYDRDGNLTLNKILIELNSNETETVYRYMDKDVIRTVFMSNDEEDESYIPNIDIDSLEQIEGIFVVTQENPLGYIPCNPIYQNQKIYNGVGSTSTFDLAQIQRSVYGDMAEIYSTITYSAHPTLVIDSNTDDLNGGQISAEPGGIIRVENNLNGQPNYVYTFEAPPLTALTEIRALVDQKIEKMNELAMIRSEDLVKRSSSGVQVEQYDAKLEAMIRKKATNLENAEYNLWQIWMDWTNQTMPQDFSISYNRQFNKRAVEHEIAEVDKMLTVYERFNGVFEDTKAEEYPSEQQAVARARELGGTGFHTHTDEDGETIYMPFATHEQYNAAVGNTDAELKDTMRDQLRQRLQQLMSSTSTSNSL